MKATFIEKESQSDYDGPCVDLYFNTLKDAFDAGVLFQKASTENKCVWQGDNFIRIPLVDMTPHGLAVVDKRKS